MSRPRRTLQRRKRDRDGSAVRAAPEAEVPATPQEVWAAIATGPGGVVYYANAHVIGVRTPDALCRFMRGFAKPVVVTHHLFGPDAEPERARQAWEAWLSRTLA